LNAVPTVQWFRTEDHFVVVEVSFCYAIFIIIIFP
jgi:hypothetical protein